MVNIHQGWLADHLNFPKVTPIKMGENFASVGLEEEAIHTSGISGPLVVGRVLYKNGEPQKNGKIINWCLVDVGSIPNIENCEIASPIELKDEDKEIFAGCELAKDVPIANVRGIICGAQNFQIGDLVVVALPGTVLPGDFAISARKTYGHFSDGMICSMRELALGDDHDGIIVLDETKFGKLKPGQNAKEILGVNNDILEINITPDRGYCASYRGLAREYAAALNLDFTDKVPGLTAKAKGVIKQRNTDENGYQVDLQSEDCKRFVVRVVRGVDPKAKSPYWLQERLNAAGMRPISLIVDIANFVMLDLGQPLHTYDLSNLQDKIIARKAKAGEKLITLDDVERELSTDDLLICDATLNNENERVIGLAGVMGGQSTEINNNSTDVLIEAAYFDPKCISKTVHHHKLPSQASFYFERGVDTNLQLAASELCVKMLTELGSGQEDYSLASDWDNTTPLKPLTFDPKLIKRICGIEVKNWQEILTKFVGCEIDQGKADAKGNFIITPPSWRPDLDLPITLVEEIIRIYGYDKIPASNDRNHIRMQNAYEDSYKVVAKISEFLACNGLTEVLSYPFINEQKMFTISAIDEIYPSVELSNPLSASDTKMRTNIMQTLLNCAKTNNSRKNDNVSLFEIGKVFWGQGATFNANIYSDTINDLPIPAQPLQLGAIIDEGYSQISAVEFVNKLAKLLNLKIAIKPIENAGKTVDANSSPAVMDLWHPYVLANLYLSDDDFCQVDGKVNSQNNPQVVFLGQVGRLHPDILSDSGFSANKISAFWLNIETIIKRVVVNAKRSAFSEKPVLSLPPVLEDLAFVVPYELPAITLKQTLENTLADLCESVTLFDTYQGKGLPEKTRGLTFRVKIRPSDKTLNTDQVRSIRQNLLHAAESIGAVLRS